MPKLNRQTQAAATAAELLNRLRALRNPANLDGMARYGINVSNSFGVPMPPLRGMAREFRRDHALAGELWKSGVREARILATLVEDPARVTPAQMDRWARQFDSWDVCDQTCQNLFRYSPFAFDKAAEWARAEGEFVRRAGFALMAGLTVKSKTAPDARFEAFLPLIAEMACDDRNFVRKAVNWALRQIGKRTHFLHDEALETTYRIKEQSSRSARWIAADAIRELENPLIIGKIRR